MSSSCSVLHSFHERGSCKLIFRCVIIFGFLSLAKIVQNNLAVRTGLSVVNRLRWLHRFFCQRTYRIWLVTLWFCRCKFNNYNWYSQFLLLILTFILTTFNSYRCFLIFHIGLNGFNWFDNLCNLCNLLTKEKISWYSCYSLLKNNPSNPLNPMFKNNQRAAYWHKKPHLPVFILKIDKCGEIWLRKFLTVSDHFVLFFAVVPSFSSLAPKKEESASLNTSFAILPSLCASISLTLFLMPGENPSHLLALQSRSGHRL